MAAPEARRVPVETGVPPRRIEPAFEVDLQCLTFSRRGDGRQGLIRLEMGGRVVALKFFGRKRGAFRSQMRALGHLAYLKRSGTSAEQRLQTEREALELWRREGFPTPRSVDLSELRGWEVPFLVLEWIDAPSVWDLIEVGPPSSEGIARLQWLAGEIGRRHRRAVTLGEPRLLHMHPIVEHVLIDGERLVTIDHEHVSTRRDALDRQVGRELMGWLRSIYQSSLSRRALWAFCDAYPQREWLLAEMRRQERSLLSRARRWLRRVRRSGRPSRGDLLEILNEWQEKIA